jgi:hypothetical protein
MRAVRSARRVEEAGPWPSGGRGRFGCSRCESFPRRLPLRCALRATAPAAATVRHCLDQDETPGIGQPHTASHAFEQGEAELALELRDLSAQRGLRDDELVRRLAETTRARRSRRNTAAGAAPCGTVSRRILICQVMFARMPCFRLAAFTTS